MERLFEACYVGGMEPGLYERFFAGDLNVLMANRFASYDRTAAVERVQALLARSAPAGP